MALSSQCVVVLLSLPPVACPPRTTTEAGGGEMPGWEKGPWRLVMASGRSSLFQELPSRLLLSSHKSHPWLGGWKGKD